MRKASGFIALITAMAVTASASSPAPGGNAPSAPASVPRYDITAMLRKGEAGYFAISPQHKMVGPVFSDRNSSQYVAEVFGLLIQAADSMASEFYKDNFDDNFTYWSFLVAALAVPHHESKLMHAHLARKGGSLPICSPELNELKGISSPSMLPVLKREYRQDTDPIFPNCSVIQERDQVEQVLISAVNRRDIGLMQLNAPTFAEAMMPNIYLNLYNTVRFGMYHLYSKFKDVRMNHSRYPCLSPSNPYAHIKNTRPASFYNLIRGVWGGGYNIGNTLRDSICRFANAQHPDAQKDANFKKHLDALVVHGTSIFHKYLPDNSLERKALDEIVYNFRAAFTAEVEKERHDNVRAIVQKDYFSKYMNGYSKVGALNPTYYLTTKRLLFRMAPVKEQEYVCGIVHGSAVDKKPTLHVEKVWTYKSPYTGKEETWAAVRLSKYATNVEFTSNDSRCFFKERDMFFVDGSHISEVTNKDLRNVDLIGHVTQRGRVFNVLQFYSLDSSVIAQVRSGDQLHIVEVIYDKVKVRDRKTGQLKDSPFKWYKVLVPGQPNTFGYVHESAFENVTERD